MASTIPQLQERLQLVHRAYPDKRKREYKKALQDAYESTIQELHIENKKLHSRIKCAATDTATLVKAKVNHIRYEKKRVEKERKLLKKRCRELHDKLMDETAKTKKLMSRAATATFQNDSPSSCAICMDEMNGRVSLVCGHEMCPECFAQHARLHNTCPFCRDEFAPKPKIPNKMPIHHIGIMAEQWAFEYIESTDHLSSHYNEDDIECLIDYACLLIENVKHWYDQEIP